MEKISKPELVTFLRLCDHHKWLSPRVRYASIRSKPMLLKDLKHHFRESMEESPWILTLIPRNCVLQRTLPRIQYDYAEKRFLLDGDPLRPPARQPSVSFSRRGPVTLHF